MCNIIYAFVYLIIHEHLGERLGSSYELQKIKNTPHAHTHTCAFVKQNVRVYMCDIYLTL